MCGPGAVIAHGFELQERQRGLIFRKTLPLAGHAAGGHRVVVLRAQEVNVVLLIQVKHGLLKVGKPTQVSGFIAQQRIGL